LFLPGGQGKKVWKGGAAQEWLRGQVEKGGKRQINPNASLKEKGWAVEAGKIRGVPREEKTGGEAKKTATNPWWKKVHKRNKHTRGAKKKMEKDSAAMEVFGKKVHRISKKKKKCAMRNRRLWPRW